jgi:hypothetical protein
MFFIDTETVPPAAGVLALAGVEEAGGLVELLELLELEPHAESASAASGRERSESRFIAQTVVALGVGH